jgi:hypothetical protein
VAEGLGLDLKEIADRGQGSGAIACPFLHLGFLIMTALHDCQPAGPSTSIPPHHAERIKAGLADSQRKEGKGTGQNNRLVLGISSNILFLGMVSFFTDISSELIAAVLPAFLFVTLGTSPEIIGTIEGAAESLTSFLKLASGVAADRTGNRKQLTVAGYSLSNFVKPLMGLVSSWPQVLALRMGDRIGKGIRTPPRDAMIADSTEECKMGAAFGVHRTLDQLGAVVGPLLAFALLAPLGFGGIFLLTIIPGSMAVAILFILVKEPKRRECTTKVTLKGAKRIMDRAFSMYIGSAALML